MLEWGGGAQDCEGDARLGIADGRGRSGVSRGWRQLHECFPPAISIWCPIGPKTHPTVSPSPHLLASLPTALRPLIPPGTCGCDGTFAAAHGLGVEGQQDSKVRRRCLSYDSILILLTTPSVSA